MDEKSYFFLFFYFSVVGVCFSASGWPNEGKPDHWFIYRYKVEPGGYGNTKDKLNVFDPETCTFSYKYTGGTSLKSYHYESFAVMYCNNGEWKSACHYNFSVSEGSVTFDFVTELPSDEECPKCVTEKEAKIQECGGEEYIINWSDETCTGECKPPPCTENLTEGQQTYDEALLSCLNRGGLKSYDESTCQGACADTNNGPPDKCEDR